uniref:C2 domain-containing protein n=1 Tax=Rhodosorus marinus TaxID=101924 RepID=A0A7S3EEN1_9RHOD|mmetsp:Transcript_30448/g.116663  ORF Transcript_30448/g.116663 Transcript_30448/m.116663 type:complete len:307 (+) Transcript_30448:947-1867(+)|eukprot:CAMPEP_0113954746 /NCGR_PEP_ID=MMETSP0011_2-20120614/800_1 /TAXON_ID=101924 /ORGANISM="Rhodosorus marinus" /LENGTH=306 /DNA_ID=CAMNT_0000964061 /DNA_START=888 /DNA_END=1808 /DNA_ORIENTATION=+ /assembly_acc=CAM_ASM_000156
MGDRKFSLRFAGHGLARLDEYSLTDPFLVLFVRHNSSEKYVQYAKTQTLYNDLDPEFPEQFTFQLKPNLQYQFKVLVYDADLPDMMLTIKDRYSTLIKANEKHLYSKDLVGEAEFTLEQLQLMTLGRIELGLKKRIRGRTRERGRLTVFYELLRRGTGAIFVHIRAKNAAQAYHRHYDYKLKLYRLRRDKEWMLVHSQKLVFRSKGPNKDSDVEFNGVRVDHGHVNGDWMGKLRMWLFFRTNTTARVTYIMGVFEFCLNDIVRRRNTFSSAAQFRVPFGTLGPLPPLMKPTIEPINLHLSWFNLKE